MLNLFREDVFINNGFRLPAFSLKLTRVHRALVDLGGISGGSFVLVCAADRLLSLAGGCGPFATDAGYFVRVSAESCIGMVKKYLHLTSDAGLASAF